MTDQNESAPIKSAASLASAAPELITRHIAWEIRSLLNRSGLTQESLGIAIGHDQAYVSKLVGAKRRLPSSEAILLDKLGHAPNLDGQTFEGLVAAREEAEKARITRRGRIKPGTNYKIFLASPMMTAGASYESARSEVLDFVYKVRARCGFEVFYAGEAIAKREDFYTADIALETNAANLFEASHFILYIPHHYKTAVEHHESPQKVSSVWVELGIALGLNIPVTIFIPNESELPYLLRRAGQHKTTLAPNVSVQSFDNDSRGPVNLVERHGSTLFIRD